MIVSLLGQNRRYHVFARNIHFRKCKNLSTSNQILLNFNSSINNPKCLLSHSSSGLQKLGIRNVARSYGTKTFIDNIDSKIIIANNFSDRNNNNNSNNGSSNNISGQNAHTQSQITDEMFLKASQEGKVGLIGMYIYELDKGGVLVTPKHHDYYLKACVVSRDASRALSYMNSLNESQLTESSYLIGLQACREAKNPSIANLMFNRLSAHIEPANISISIWVEMMKTYGIKGDYDGAMTILSKLKQHNFPNNLGNHSEALLYYNGILSVYSNCSKFRKLHETISEMKSLGIELNEESWIWRIKIAARSNVNDLLKISNEWISSESSKLARQNESINNNVNDSSILEVSYSKSDVINEIFQGFRSQNSSTAMRVYDTLKDLKYMRSLFTNKTYSILLGVGAKHKVKGDIHSILTDMIINNVELNESLWSKVIFPVYDSDIDINSLLSIIDIYNKKCNGQVPEFLFRSLISLYVKNRDIKRAIECLEAIKKSNNGNMPSIETYNHLVRLLALADNWDTCLTVFRTMRSMGYKASRDMWSILLTSVASNRTIPLSLIHNMINEMIEQDNINPDAAMWNDIIKEIQSRDSQDYHLQRYQYSMIHNKKEGSSNSKSDKISTDTNLKSSNQNDEKTKASSIESFLGLFPITMQHKIIRDTLDVSVDEVQLSQVRTLLKCSSSLFWDCYGSLMKVASTAGHFHLCNSLVSDLLQHNEMKLHVNLGCHYDSAKKNAIKPESFDISLNLSIFISYLIRAFEQQEQLSKGVQIMGLILQKFNNNLSLTTSLVEMAYNRQSNILNSLSPSSGSNISADLQQPHSSPKLRISPSLSEQSQSLNRSKVQKFLDNFDNDIANTMNAFHNPSLLSSDIASNHTVSSLHNLKPNRKHSSSLSINNGFLDDELLELIHSDRIFIVPTIDFFESALRLCGKAGKHQLARKILQYMEIINIPPTRSCRHHTLCSFFVDQNYEEAKEWALLAAERLCLSHLASNASLSHLDNSESAIELLEQEMNTIISPILEYYWNNMSNQKVNSFIESMISRNILLSNDTTCKYVKLLTKKKEFEEAVQFIEHTIRIRMRFHSSNTLFSNNSIYSSNNSSFLSGILNKFASFLTFSKNKQIEEYNELVNSNRAANSKSFENNSMDSDRSRNTFSAAKSGIGNEPSNTSSLELKHLELQRKVHLDSLPLWHIVITSSAEANNLDMTFWALHTMRLKYDLRLENSGWKSVIQLLCKTGNIREAKDLLVMMVSMDNIIPDTDLWRLVLAEEGKTGDVMTCLKTIEIMESIALRTGDDSLRPNHEHWNYVIESATRSRNPNNSLDLLRNLVERQNVKLSENSYRLVLDLFRMRDQDKEVVEVLNLMSKYGIKIGENILHSLQNMKRFQNIADKINEIKKIQ